VSSLVFIGDSLTEWYDWQARFPGYGVLNLGIAGETIEGLVNRLDRIILALEDPDCIFIMTGINNVAMEDYEIIHEYKRIINRFFSVFRKTEIVIQSLLPADLPWLDKGVITALNKELKGLAGNFTAHYLDVYGAFIGPDGILIREYLADDGVHLSDKGYEVWALVVEGYLHGPEGPTGARVPLSIARGRS
jgi:lysophospholipase L1-like esterase